MMLRQRVITAVIAVVLILLALFVFPSSLTLVLLGVLIVAGGWEWAAFLGAEGAARGLFPAVLAVAIAAVWWAVPQFLPLLPVLLAALAFWLVAAVLVMRYPIRVPRWLIWVGGLAILVPAYLALGTLYMGEPRGPQVVLFVLAVIWSADIGAYFAGRRFGRVKLAPKVSPGKTWEGVFGGLAAATLVCIAGAWWFGVSLTILLPLSLAATLLSIIGDLTVSLFKRSAGVKDSGHLFPGHGGVLDRVDSLAAASPLFLLMLRLLGLA
ncbi:phosphatidate cytidylyltransferase [Lentisalinibacter salinarum]|uniref:phosphatidate cytidylyltransferase n=1 Tax=Lentisalinibacter salinarum TaxID=2992239 RepID=UPI00386802EF